MNVNCPVCVAPVPRFDWRKHVESCLAIEAGIHPVKMNTD